MIYKRTLSWPFGAYARGSDMRFEFDAVSAAFDQLVYLVDGLTPDQQLIGEVNQTAIAAATQGAADQALITGYTITQSRDRAEQAASDALASENLSEQWAVNPEDIEVTTGRYSSLHYSKKAQFNNWVRQWTNHTSNATIAIPADVFAQHLGVTTAGAIELTLPAMTASDKALLQVACKGSNTLTVIGNVDGTGNLVLTDNNIKLIAYDHPNWVSA